MVHKKQAEQTCAKQGQFLLLKDVTETWLQIQY